MTTELAAAAYLAEHMQTWGEKGYATYNPNNLPVDDLPTIYGFNNGGQDQMLFGVLFAEDGEWLGSHCCSNESYMPHDLGVLEGSRADRHEHFRAHYPGGYKMDFVAMADVMTHPGLEAAYQKNQANSPAA